MIDFTPYLRRLETRLADPRYPSSLYVPQSLTYMLGREQREEDNAQEAIWNWMTQPSGSFVVVLGDFGSGKTFLARETARRLLQHQSITPVFIDLRRLNRSQNIEGLLATHLAQEEFKEFNLEAFRYMTAEGRLALLFDGYDELELRVGFEQAAEHFDTICSAAGGRARVLITSRTQHFKSDEQVLNILGKRAETAGARLVKVAPFNRSRIRLLLTKKLGTEDAADQRLHLLDNIRDLSKLAENPRMLGFISDIPLEKLEAARKRGERITEASLYGELLDWWLTKEVQLANPGGERPGLSVSHLWFTIESLALKCWHGGSDDFGLEGLTEAARALRDTSEIGIEPEAVAHQTGSRSLLVRHGDRFRFLHFSILEWLVARAAARNLTGQADTLSKREISPLMARFLVDLAERAKVLEWADVILAESSNPKAKANALLIRREAGIREPVEQAKPAPIILGGLDLRGKNFTDAVLVNANLRGANLEGVLALRADFTGADLRGALLAEADLTNTKLMGADLSDADLSFAKLNGADLTGIQWNERTRILGMQMLAVRKDAGALEKAGSNTSTPAKSALEAFVLSATPVDSLAFSSDAQLIACANGHRISIWHVRSGRLLRFLTGHTGYVRSVAFDPSARWLASGSYDNTIRLWSIQTGTWLATLFSTPEGWVVFRPSGEYRFAGNLGGHFWHAIGLARLEPGEPDPYFPHLRLADDEPLIPSEKAAP